MKWYRENQEAAENQATAEKPGGFGKAKGGGGGAPPGPPPPVTKGGGGFFMGGGPPRGWGPRGAPPAASGVFAGWFFKSNCGWGGRYGVPPPPLQKERCAISRGLAAEGLCYQGATPPKGFATKGLRRQEAVPPRGLAAKGLCLQGATPPASERRYS